MSKQDNFEQLLEDRPADALKYVEAIESNPFWQYYQAKLRRELKACDVQLRSCPLDKVVFVRGFREGIRHRVELPARVIETLKTDIALEKEAAKIEAARQPEEEKE